MLRTMMAADQEAARLIDSEEDADEDVNKAKFRHDRQTATIEEAMDAAGFGSFHYRLLIVSGIMWAADAIEILCISFVLPAAECDLGLTSADKGWLNATVFIGLLVGGYIGGGLGDTFGRKGVLFISMISNGLFGIASSFMPTFGPFLFFRFLSATGVGAALPVNMPYFAEFQPSDRRGKMVTFLASFFLVGNVIAAVLAWLTIPSHLELSVGYFPYSSWRLFVALCGVPSTLAGCLILWFPESPRYLAALGRDDEALEVVKGVWKANQIGWPGSWLSRYWLLYRRRRGAMKKRHRGEFPVQHILPSTMNPEEDIWPGDANRQLLQPSSALQKVVLKTKQLMFSSYSRNFWILFSIHFSIAFGYYGLMMWFPELFNRLQRYTVLHPNATHLGVCDVSSVVNEEMVSDTPQCSTPDASVYTNQLLVALAPLPTNLWNILHMDVLGRKFFLILSMVASGSSVFAIWLVTSETSNLLVSMLFSSISNMGFNALNCLATELFPTSMRSTAMALTAAALRIGAFLGNVAFGYFIDKQCAVPMVLVAVLLTGGGLMGFLLPETARTRLT